MSSYADPVVRLGAPLLVDETDPDVVLEDALHLTCSSCGDLSDWLDASDSTRTRLGHLARGHANAEHDGLVVAEGWVR